MANKKPRNFTAATEITSSWEFYFQPATGEEVKASISLLLDYLAANGFVVDADLVGLMSYKGGYNAATNSPDLDSPTAGAVKKGYAYAVTTAGTFLTAALEVGDVLIAEIDDPSTLGDWTLLQNNLGAATESTSGYVRLASQSEVDTGTEAAKVVTPATLAAVPLPAARITGTVTIAHGGTGLTSLGTAGQLLKVNAGATALEYFTPAYLLTVSVSSQFSGTGASGSPITLSQQGASTGQGLGWNGSAWAPWTFFHAGNDGASSGLDADLLDGQHGSYYLANSMATGKLLGRSTASTGAVEEITIGSGLSLSGGTLTATGSLTGSGTTNYLPKWSGSTALGNSVLYETGGIIGLNTSSPVFNLHVADATLGYSYVHLTTTATGHTVSDGFTFGLNSASDAIVYNRESANILFGTSATERMRITSGGLVGIGLTPAKKLDILDASNAQLRLTHTASTVYADLQQDGTNLTIKSTGSVGLYPAGSVGLNVTSSYVTAYKSLEANSTSIDIGRSGQYFGTGYLTGLNIGSGLLKLPDGTESNPAETFSADLNTGVFRPTTDVYAITAGGTERMRTSANGLAVKNAVAGIDIESTCSTPIVVRIASGGLWGHYLDGSDYRFWKTTTGDIMTLTGAGNVGIGTTTPAQKLHVAGNIQFVALAPGGNVGAIGQALVSGGGSSNNWANVTTGSGAAGYIAFWNGTVSQSYDSTLAYDATNKRVGIGTGSPAQALHVVGNLQWTGAAMPNGSAGTSGQVLTSAGSGAPPTWSDAGTIGGSAASTRVAYGSGTNALTSSANFTYSSGLLEAARSAGASIRAAYSAGSVYTDLGTNSSGYGFLSPTGKRLGLNTTAPLSTLHLQNDGDNTQGGLFLDHSSATMSTGSELQIDLALGGTAMARVSAVKESSGYGLKFYSGGSAAVNASPAIAITGSNDVTILNALSSSGVVVTLGSTAAGAATNFLGSIGSEDYSDTNSPSAAFSGKSWHFANPTGAATRALPSGMADGTWVFITNESGTYDITVTPPSGQTIVGSTSITTGKTGFFVKKGTVWTRIILS